MLPLKRKKPKKDKSKKLNKLDFNTMFDRTTFFNDLYVAKAAKEARIVAET